MTKNPHYIFLEKLRRSGKTNMFGAVPYITVEFGCSHKEAEDILLDWMKNYKQSDYEGMFEDDTRP